MKIDVVVYLNFIGICKVFVFFMMLLMVGVGVMDYICIGDWDEKCMRCGFIFCWVVSRGKLF